MDREALVYVDLDGIPHLMGRLWARTRKNKESAHDYGTRILKRTGNLAAVMRTMGHKDVKMAMQYQHPELEIVRAALDQDSAVEKRA